MNLLKPAVGEGDSSSPALWGLQPWQMGSQCLEAFVNLAGPCSKTPPRLSSRVVGAHIAWALLWSSCRSWLRPVQASPSQCWASNLSTRCHGNLKLEAAHGKSLMWWEGPGLLVREQGSLCGWVCPRTVLTWLVQSRETRGTHRYPQPGQDTTQASELSFLRRWRLRAPSPSYLLLGSLGSPKPRLFALYLCNGYTKPPPSPHCHRSPIRV